jgi:protein-tyrosine phosphatase
MLQPDVYWLREVEGVRLAIMPRPRSGEWLADEITGYQRLGVQTVVSLLESSEAKELDLVNEESLCRAASLQFLSFPIADRSVPNNSVEFAKFVESIAFRLRSGDSVAIHCRAGIGRSGLLAACVLGTFGVAPDSAFTMLGRARGVAVPDTDAQAAWVRDYLRNKLVPTNPWSPVVAGSAAIPGIDPLQTDASGSFAVTKRHRHRFNDY